MILTNYYVHGFLIGSIIVFYALIIYFNFNAITNTLKNKVIKISVPPGECNYENTPLIKDNQKCTKNNNFYITLGNSTYLLSTIEKNYIDVCKTLCDSFDNLTNICQGDNRTVGEYNDCLDNLKPGAACNGLQKPLGYRFDNDDKTKTFFYAKDIIQINNCI